MHAATAVLTLVIFPGLTCAQGVIDDKRDYQRVQAEWRLSRTPSIELTINPEVRVSATFVGPLPPPVRCGTPAELTVKIINHGFVTSQLEAELVNSPPAYVALEFHPEPLKGIAEELRELRITLTKPLETDLTIAFRTKNGIPDLGGRDRVHFLIQCISPSTTSNDNAIYRQPLSTLPAIDPPILSMRELSGMLLVREQSRFSVIFPPCVFSPS